jgi:hypothetical protein
MTERKTPSAKTRRPKTGASPGSAGGPGAADELSAGDQISYSALSLHDLFEQQTRQLLASADLNEEERQNILIAMSCPCCGAGAMSYTLKLKR